VEQVSGQWCGRLAFTVGTRSRRPRRARCVAFDVHLDWVSVLVDDEVKAVIDRHKLQQWIADGDWMLIVDSVGLTQRSGALILYVGSDWFTVVPEEVAGPLIRQV
jgi:hypothetical protein